MEPIKGSQAFRFSSPALKPDQSVLFECPVGAILREFPLAYETINACNFIDRSGIDGLGVSDFLRSAYSVVSAEKMRLEKIRQQDRQTSRDADYAKRILNGRHN